MTCLKSNFLYSALLGLVFLSISCGKKDPNYPHPADNSSSALMLRLPDVGIETETIEYSQLPHLTGKHAVVSRGDDTWHYRLHSYLEYFDNRYWCLWSHGPIVEDKPTQHIRFSTSSNGVDWSAPEVLVGPSSQEGFRHIARGFWLKGDGRLRALASHDEALKDGRTHFFGESLDLRSYLWNPENRRWDFEGIIFDDTINNFPPKLLETGDWMMTRRSASRTISFLVGGISSISDWKVVPYSIKDRPDGLKPEEPFWYRLPDGNLVALARDNARSGRLLRSFSVDNGNSWTAPVRTNFPDATSKFNVLRTSKGFYVLVNNANPEQRNPLCLSVSKDGLVYTSLVRLPIPDKIDGVSWEKESSYSSTKYESFQYPHILEHAGQLLVTFSRKKQTVEVIKVSLDEVAALLD